jgi:ATP adenylyltransferase/5',5'''-P-1,P-4-tetraphosphate phosphorylase II
VHLARKPILPSDAPERKGGGKHDPFADPNDEEIIAEVGTYHRLLVNTYAVYRPSLLLVTKEYYPQTDDLCGPDLNAAWTVMQLFKEKFMMIVSSPLPSANPLSR